MSINIDSEVQCRRAYLGYLRLGEASGVSYEDFIRIKARYAELLTQWISMSPDDVNYYIFSDDEFDDANKSGFNAAKTLSGYNDSAGWNAAASAGVAVTGVGNAVFAGVTGGAKALAATNGKLLSSGGKAVKSLVKDGKKACPEGASAGQTMAYAQAVLAVAMAAYYWIARPNQEEKVACDDLLNQMANNEMALNDQVAALEDLQATIEEKSKETADANTAANDKIKSHKATQFLYQTTIKSLEARKAAGENLTPEEENTINMYKGYVNQEQSSIGAVADDITQVTEESYAELDGLVGNYDDVASVIGEIQGTVDFAAGMDKAAQASAYMEAVGQGANAASGFMAAAKLFSTSFGVNWVNLAMGAAATAAGISSLAAAKEQVDWAGQIGNEIAAREAIDQYNQEVLSQYEDGVTNYEDIKLEIEEYETDV